jgi:hypothetical protein
MGTSASAAAASPHSAQETTRDTIASAAAASPHSAQETKRDTIASAAAASPHSAQETKRDTIGSIAIEGVAATTPAGEEAKSVGCDFCDLQFSKAEKPGPLAAHCGVRGPASSEGTMAEALASSRWLAKLLDMREAARGVPGSDPTMLQLEADIVTAVKFDEQFSHVHAAVASRRAALKVDEQFSHIVAEDAVASKAAQQKRRKRRPG